MWQHLRSAACRCSRVLLASLALVGCEGPAVPDSVSRPHKPFENVSLRLTCPSDAVKQALEPLAKSWGQRTGAAVTLQTAASPLAAASDAAVITPEILGELAERGEALAVPASLTESKAFRWGEVVGPIRDRLTRWGNRAYAVPLAGGGHVLVYRSDRLADPGFVHAFRARTSREPSPPASWEEFAELAEALRESNGGKPSLPALPAAPHDLVEIFSRVAASYDRTADSEIKGLTRNPNAGASALSFQNDVQTGKPRLTTAGFEAALRWLVRVQACAAPGANGDPVAALADGHAAMAILDLQDLARLPRQKGMVAAHFGLARIPGAQTPTGVNYVPYVSGGILGVVRKDCASAEAAFDLFADLGSPERSAELIAAGFGPVRNEHFERSYWQGYGFDPRRTGDLANAVRGDMATDVSNPTFLLRGPDQNALTQSLARELRAALGQGVAPAEALRRADTEWLRLNAEHPAEVRQWRRLAAGLN